MTGGTRVYSYTREGVKPGGLRLIYAARTAV